MSVFTNAASSTPEQTAAYIEALLHLLDDSSPVDVLSSTIWNVRARLDGLSAEQLARAEAPGKWSIRQVLQHFADSELVWGWRLRMVLAHDRPQITGYDQDLWADRLCYQDSDPQQALHDFATLRAANLRLLARAAPEDLERIGVHAERGEESVSHMMRLYAAHDQLHLNQLDRIRAAVSS